MLDITRIYGYNDFRLKIKSQTAYHKQGKKETRKTEREVENEARKETDQSPEDPAGASRTKPGELARHSAEAGRRDGRHPQAQRASESCARGDSDQQEARLNFETPEIQQKRKEGTADEKNQEDQRLSGR